MYRMFEMCGFCGCCPALAWALAVRGPRKTAAFVFYHAVAAVPCCMPACALPVNMALLANTMRLRQCSGGSIRNATSLPNSALWGEQHYLDSAGRWGMMEEGRWKAFLEWLDESGLLRDKVRRRCA